MLAAGVGSGLGSGVGDAAGDGSGVTVMLAMAVGVAVGVTFGVTVAVTVGVALGVEVLVAVGVAVRVAVDVGVTVGVGVGRVCTALVRAAKASIRPQPNISSRPGSPRSTAVDVIMLATWRLVREGFTDHTRPARPETWGVACEVPSIYA